MDLDYSNYLQFFLALIFVLGLIGAVAIVLRHFGLGGAIRLQRRLKGERQRLEVTDVIPIDARRRLILVRRDDTEHLILLGLNEDILIEGGIPARDVPSQTVRQDQSDNSTGVNLSSIVTTIQGKKK